MRAVSDARARSTPEDSRPALLAALGEVARWREQAEAQTEHALAEVASDEARVQAAIQDLHRRLAVLERRREELRAASGQLDAEEVLRSHQAVLRSLAVDQALLHQRGAELEVLRGRSRARADALLQNPEIQSALREYEGFAEVEASLGALPPSYRRAILAHNDQIRRQLEPLFAELTGSAARLDLPPATVSLIASVEPAQGPPEALVLITPLSADLSSGWEQRPMDLPAALAYRLLAALCGLAARLGAPDAPIRYHPFEGHLAFQLWFGRRPLRGDVREVCVAMLERARSQSAELGQAGLDWLVVWLPASVLEVDEDDDEDEDTEGEQLVMKQLPRGGRDRDSEAGEFLIADPGSEA